MSAYYNEHDPKAAAWLRELIAADLIPAGEVDERSIADVRPTDLAGFRQCHFFAGIGGWACALRLAGWPDDRPVWTGSCPCQPFSNAGARKGEDDDRHLWPALRGLIAECRPASLFGEQVASRLGRDWLAAVRADLEALGYAVGAADLCAAGVGAPHIRQRLWFGATRLADAEQRGCQGGTVPGAGPEASLSAEGGDMGRLADADGERQPRGPEPHVGPLEPGQQAPRRDHALRCGVDGRLADASGARVRDTRPGEDAGAASGVGREAGEQRLRADAWDDGGGRAPGSRPPDSAWRDADWLLCRDGRWRPVEPGTFPLAHGIPGRVGLLRGYGNAIVPEVATAFITSLDDALADARAA